MANANPNTPDDAGQDDGLDSAEDRAAFAAMEGAGDTGDAPAGGEAPDGADDGGAAEGAAGAAGGDGAAGAAPAAGAADGGAAAAAAVDADAGDDDGEDDDGDDAAPGEAKIGADGKPEKRRKTRVSGAKFKREQDRAKQLETDLAESRERIARFDERFKILGEALTKPNGGAADVAAAEDDDPMPDPQEQVFEHIGWQNRQREKLQARLDKMESGAQAKDASEVVATRYAQDATDFAAKEPNFVGAYQHLLESRYMELAMYKFGIDLSEPDAKVTPQQAQWIKNSFLAEERQLATEAINAQQSPARRIFALAKSRGWRAPVAAAATAAPAAPAARTNGGQQQNGAANPAAGAGAEGGAAARGTNGGGKPAGEVSVGEEIDRIKNGVDASLSLSSGGAAPANPLNAKRLADMPQEEFDRLADTITPEEFQMLVEGSPG